MDASKVKMASGPVVEEMTIEKAEWLLTVRMPGGTGWKLADPDYELIEGKLVKKPKKSKKEE